MQFIDDKITAAFNAMKAKGLLTSLTLQIPTQTFDPATGDVTQEDVEVPVDGIVFNERREYRDGDITKQNDATAVLISSQPLAMRPNDEHTILVEPSGAEWHVMSSVKYWDGSTEVWELGLQGGECAT